MRHLLFVSFALLLCVCSTSTPLHQLFELMDTNADGAVTHGELVSYGTLISGHIPGERSLHSAAKRLNDGVFPLSYNDFAARFQRLSDSPRDMEPQQIHLSWGPDSTSVTIIWVNFAESDGVLHWSETSSSVIITAPATRTTYNVGSGWNGFVYTVTLHNLSFGTSYTYHCSNNNATTSAAYTFHTARPVPLADDAAPTYAAIFADMGTVIPLGFAVTEQMVTDRKQFDWGFALLAGDISYAGIGGPEEHEWIWDLFGRQMEPLAAVTPLMTAVGNHEEYFNYTAYRTRYSMPGDQQPGGNGNFWFSFDYERVHVLSFSTENHYNPGSEQYQWMERDLAAAVNNRHNVPWIIVTCHKPMYAADTFEEDTHIPGAPLQVQVEPLLLKYEVDLMIVGHSHVYNRMYPVANGVPMVTGTNVYPKSAGGVPHVVQGTGGAFYPDSWRTDVTWSAVHMMHYGYGRMTAFNQTHLHYEFVEHETLQVVDDFWLVHDKE